MGRWEDFRWHLAGPDASPIVDLVAGYQRRGWIEVVQAEDTYGSSRMLARARITPAGRRRMDELLLQGVEPEDPLEKDNPGA